MKTSMIKSIKYTALLLGIATMPVLASAGTFKTITIDGDFSDWDGVPVFTTDITTLGTPPLGFTALSVANDDDFVYLRVQYDGSHLVNSGANQIFITLDNDNDANTGFNIFGLGVIGSEVGWQNDFPFDQRGGFNSGSIDNGGASIAPFFTTTTQQEIALSRNATFTTGGTVIFPNDTFGLGVYVNTDASNYELIAGTGSSAYTVAVPEPGHAGIFLAIGAIGIIAYRRRCRS
ncbi:hypothetical protein [Rubellicoccus peritrichatus]|uniref:PEP-CTERM protein-sorting domain-containing protein n=1 Tax=Rubellicoccus peritrichatus TaxID=3080537 RepID=A0AAQ3QUS8_9BACT|nr:hypothetical protein [Puniceicoccus sp. CR14]WOO40713.1 hypothetical protein RZN69_18990 [Puniceicoccus sp. CR14]